MLSTMKIRTAAIAVLLAVAALTGCSSSAPEATPTPTQTSDPEATPEQVASVIAEYESDWREVIDGAFDCRFTWTMDDSPTGQLEGMTCFTTEKTIGITAQLVTRDWAAMDVPASMQGLVDDTTEVLGRISDVDLDSVCGTDSIPSSTQECNEALGNRNATYLQLESQLDKWGPYL